MAQIVGGGPPTNESERLVIAHLRDSAPDNWVVLHNVEIPAHGTSYEVDLIVVTEQSVAVVDVKGTRGRIHVAGSRWHPEGRASFHSPVRKLRGHARALKGLFRDVVGGDRVYVDHLVVLTATDARLLDPNRNTDADAIDVTDLDGLIAALQSASRLRPGMLRDITGLHVGILYSLHGGVEMPKGPRRFGTWEVTERLGGDDEATEYRARHATVPTGETVLLRVLGADPYGPPEKRDQRRFEVTNAYRLLAAMPRHECVVMARECFQTEDENGIVLVLEDVPGRTLTAVLDDPVVSLGEDARLAIVRDLLRALAHAHANSVIHRALTPDAVLVRDTGGAMLTGFDYARPTVPRDKTVRIALADHMDHRYTAPECQGQVQAATKASDVYAAGVIAYRLLTGELPFETATDQRRLTAGLPDLPFEQSGVSPGLASLVKRLCGTSAASRPTAAEALRTLERLTRAGKPASRAPEQSGGTDYRNLTAGHQLTGKFTVIDRLGDGSFSVVYRVFDSLARTERAVKIIDRDSESAVDRLSTEYRILLDMAPHPAIVKVIGADFLPGTATPYLELEYLDGKTAEELARSGELNPADVVGLGIEAAGGLVHLHGQGVYHLDIKPDNLFRTEAGCKIIDLNVAVTADSTLSKTGGTARFVPPDWGQHGSVAAPDLADRDVYALGLTLYKVLTGRFPFDSAAHARGTEPADPRHLDGLGDLSEAFTKVLLKAVAPGRSDRYRSAEAFRDALTAVRTEIWRRTEPTAAAHLPARFGNGRNPFVDYLQTLYSQSPRSNAGTRAGQQSPFDLYVPTALDEVLVADVLDGKFRLVVITGNAGDGKTEFLERLIRTAALEAGTEPVRHGSGAGTDANGLRLLTNYDGSQDDGEKANDEVLLEFFAPFEGADLAGSAGETRLIAINEGRMVDLLETHGDRFPALRAAIAAGLRGEGADDRIAVVNLNRRSLVTDTDTPGDAVFTKMVAAMTDSDRWEACGGCALADSCYARHNAKTLGHPGIGAKVAVRLRRLYRITELRGVRHLTMRDVQSALAYTVTSGRDCDDIHAVYGENKTDAILDGLYFNSWIGPGDGKDKLLALLREVDVAATPDPGLDRRLDFVGPDAGRALMDVDGRGGLDLAMLRSGFERLSRDGDPDDDARTLHRRYLAGAKRRFYFECLDDERSKAMLPYRTSDEFANLLSGILDPDEQLCELVDALNRSEGLSQGWLAGGALALRIRDVPHGTSRGYQTFDAAGLRLRPEDFHTSPYLEGGPRELVLTYDLGSGRRAPELRIRLDLFELLRRLGRGYLPGVADQQGLNLGLQIFKNELAAAPYQEVLLTSDGRRVHRVRRTDDRRLVMTLVESEEAVR
ncbi:Serine/threonine protein kinase [Glycomyces sambucus]|uniref:Serine/threonine protein kinase n=1 Tax=Glycomyces sambucus TaxID=380244 RepID=A0A1G9MZG2_9ACTN|nr:protein kinase [Glycomyces sambucus]SDL79391.1 Serine/threonine protein kinase [Glycomyces sambucus]